MASLVSAFSSSPSVTAYTVSPCRSGASHGVPTSAATKFGSWHISSWLVVIVTLPGNRLATSFVRAVTYRTSLISVG